jgi:hypothetical protein
MLIHPSITMINITTATKCPKTKYARCRLTGRWDIGHRGWGGMERGNAVNTRMESFKVKATWDQKKRYIERWS